MKKQIVQPAKPEANILFVVKFDDGKTDKLSATDIAKLKDKRKYDVINASGEVIMKKTYVGL